MVSKTQLGQFVANIIEIENKIEPEKKDEKVKNLIENIKNMTIQLETTDLKAREGVTKTVFRYENSVKNIDSEKLTEAFNEFMKLYGPKDQMPEKQAESIQPKEQELKLSASASTKVVKDRDIALDKSIIECMRNDRERFKSFKFSTETDREVLTEASSAFYNNMIVLLNAFRKSLKVEYDPLKELIGQFIKVERDLKSYSDSSKFSLLDRVLNAPDEQFFKPVSSLLFNPYYRPNSDRQALETELSLDTDKILIRGPDESNKYFIGTLEQGDFLEEEYANLKELLDALEDFEKSRLL